MRIQNQISAVCLEGCRLLDWFTARFTVFVVLLCAFEEWIIFLMRLWSTCLLLGSLVYKLKVGFVGIAITFGFSWDGCFISGIKGIWTGMPSEIIVQTLLLAIMTIRCNWEEQCTCHLFIHFFKKTFSAKSFISLFILFILFFFHSQITL